MRIPGDVTASAPMESMMLALLGAVLVASAPATHDGDSAAAAAACFLATADANELRPFAAWTSARMTLLPAAVPGTSGGATDAHALLTRDGSDDALLLSLRRRAGSFVVGDVNVFHRRGSLWVRSSGNGGPATAAAVERFVNQAAGRPWAAVGLSPGRCRP